MTHVLKCLGAVLLISCFLAPPDATAQTNLQRPNPEWVEDAKGIVQDSVFARLERNEPNELATWLADALHTPTSGTPKMQQENNFRSSLQMVTQNPPDGPFGSLDGYDVLQESHLPGTNRYFRLTYMTYHQEAPLVWEFHFYVTPEENVRLTYFQFNGENPFAYMSTSDMLIERYYD